MRYWPGAIRLDDEHVTLQINENQQRIGLANLMTHLVIAYDVGEEERTLLQEMLGNLASLTFLVDVPATERLSVMIQAEVVLAWNLNWLITPDQYALLNNVRLLQLLSAGANQVPFGTLPSEVIVASNVGAYAEPMAEHTLAMALTLAKRLHLEHQSLRRGEFNQYTFNPTLRGAVCGILGFGGIGQATARLMRAIGMEIYAINRSDHTRQPVAFIGTLNDLEQVLRVSDVVVISLPLNRTTRRLIGSKELAWMKPDAILINIARGEIIDEAALYHHLKKHPDFMAGIDAWWIEPFGHGKFDLNYPFLELPNVLGSPHNSAMVPGALLEGVRRAAENTRRFLNNEPLTGLVRREDYL